MKYIVDTDILIYFFKNNKNVVEQFSKINDDDIFTTIINYTELLFGAYNSLRIEENLKKFKSFLEDINVLNFDKAAAEKFAQLKTKLKQEGNLIEDLDLMIASICLVNHCVLVTNNTRHFSRIQGLAIEDWA